MPKFVELYLYSACGRNFLVTGHAGIRGNVIADGLACGGTALRFLGPERALVEIHKKDRSLVGQPIWNPMPTSCRDPNAVSNVYL